MSNPHPKLFGDLVQLNFENAYLAGQKGAIIADRFHRAQIRASGADRERLLQNILSNDLRGMKDGSGLYATFLSNKGKLLTNLTMYKEPECLFLETELDHVNPFIQNISRYIISEDVVLTSLVGIEGSFSVEGPQAGALLASLWGIQVHELGELDHLRANARGYPVTVAYQPHGPGASYDIRAPMDQLEKLASELVNASAVPASKSVMETRRIERGIPQFGFDLDEQTMPLEAGLENSISFNKGCYIGQEYVVRLAHRGHVNRKLMGLIISGSNAPALGAELIVEKEYAGRVTSVTYSPIMGSVIALAYVQRAFLQPGTKVNIPSISTTALVSALPFLTSYD